MEQENAPAAAEARRPGLIARAVTRVRNFRNDTIELFRKIRKAPTQSLTVSLILVFAGWVGEDGYHWAKAKVINQETAIDRIASQQKEEFEALRASLDALRGDIRGSGLGDAKDAVRALERLANSNLDKLRLAQQENDKLRAALAGAGKVSDGYDALLSEQESMQLDPGTVLGVNSITDTHVWLTFSTPETSEKPKYGNYRPGESIPFVRRTGEKCLVSVLSLREGVNAASFAVSCEDGAKV
ncbi:hypothetical protein [Arenimonas sp.]|uniref:hypothetical protein n=1 Tax=Arenimonas sp. TaxID=1872635 RepID=UPI0035AF39B6